MLNIFFRNLIFTENFRNTCYWFSDECFLVALHSTSNDHTDSQAFYRKLIWSSNSFRKLLCQWLIYNAPIISSLRWVLKCLVLLSNSLDSCISVYYCLLYYLSELFYQKVHCCRVGPDFKYRFFGLCYGAFLPHPFVSLLTKILNWNFFQPVNTWC